jgi:hypothetical protein
MGFKLINVYGNLSHFFFLKKKSFFFNIWFFILYFVSDMGKPSKASRKNGIIRLRQRQKLKKTSHIKQIKAKEVIYKLKYKNSNNLLKKLKKK